MSKPVMDDPKQEFLRMRVNNELAGMDRDEMMRVWRSWIWLPAPPVHVRAEDFDSFPWLMPIQKAIVGARLGRVQRNQG